MNAIAREIVVKILKNDNSHTIKTEHVELAVETIILLLSYNSQEALKMEFYPYNIPRYLKDGKIDMNYLLKDFQEFWRENSTDRRNRAGSSVYGSIRMY